MIKLRRTARVRRVLLLVSMTATAVTFLAPNAKADSLLSISKASSDLDGGSLEPGDTIEYTIQISNAGPDTATGVTFDDDLPANTQYVTGSATIDGGNTVDPSTYPFGADMPLADIPMDGVVTATFDVTVNSPLANGTSIDNTASVTASNDPATPKTSTTNDSVTSAPTLGVTKTSDPAEGGTVNPGDTITYTIVVSNTGNDVADDPVLTDDEPANTTYLPGSATIDDGTTIDNSANPFVSPGLTIADLAAGDSTTATFQVVVDGPPLANNTPIQNDATVSAANFTGTVSDDADHTVTSTPGLTVDKTSDPAEGGTIVPGATITYTIVVANDALATESANNVVVTDPTPADTTYVADSATVDSAPEAGATNPFESGYDLGDVDPGESHTLTFQVLVDRPLDNGTTLTNTATVSSTQGPDMTNDAVHTVQSAPVLTMAKTAVPVEGGKVTPGTVVSYAMAITNDNTATETAKGVKLTDPTPANTTYVQGSAKVDGTPIEGSDNPLASGYSVRDLPPGDTATISFDVKVASPLAKGTVISNLAKLTADNHSDIEDGATHTVDSAPVMKVSLASDPKAGTKLEAGDTIAYGVVVSNDAAATDTLKSVTVKATTPEGTTFVDGSLKAGGSPTVSRTAAAPSPLEAGYSLGDLAPGQSRSLDWALEVGRSAGSIDTAVTVSAAGVPAVTATASHRGPGGGSGSDGGSGGGGGGAEDGSAFGLDDTGSSGGTASGSGSGELAFTGLDMARLLTLAFSLFLVGWTLLARGRSMQRRVARAGVEDRGSPGFPAWDRWAGSWFFPEK